MTTEELMIERYKVKNPYPHSPYKVGDIIKPNNGRFVLTQTEHRDEWGETVRTEHLHKIEVAKQYENLFEPLPWWKERNDDEMPLYVKHKHGWIDKHIGVNHSGDCFTFIGRNETIDWKFDWFQPATEADYNAYLQATNTHSNNK